MMDLNKIISFEELISCVPEDKIIMLRKLFLKAQNILRDEKKRYGITIPHLINFLVRNGEFSDAHRDLLIILQKKLREFEKKDSNLYIEIK
jgi:hypothetical protein